MIIDLTHTLNEDITVYPGTLGPKIEVLNTVENDGFAELKLSMVLHSGTHIDAPCHVIQNGKSLDEFPVDAFIGIAMVIPCRDQTTITVEFLERFESQIARVDFVLFYTGWQYKWKTEAYAGNCPIPTREAAHWLTRFKLKGIGFDAFSVDPVVSATTIEDDTLPNHHILLGRDILLIENLTNLDRLPASPFHFQCLPLKVEHADGSPVRAIAIVEG